MLRNACDINPDVQHGICPEFCEDPAGDDIESLEKAHHARQRAWIIFGTDSKAQRLCGFLKFLFGSHGNSPPRQFHLNRAQDNPGLLRKPGK